MSEWADKEVDEAIEMRENDLYEDDDIWDDEEVEEEEDLDEDLDEEYCEFCEESDCDGECQDSGWWGDDEDDDDDDPRYDYEEDPDEYWYGEDD